MQHGVVHVINVFTCGSPEQSSHTCNNWFVSFSTSSTLVLTQAVREEL